MRTTAPSPFSSVPMALVAALLCTACTPRETGPVQRAEAALERTMASDPQFEEYGLALAAEHPTAYTTRVALERLASGSSTLPTLRALGPQPPEQAREALRRIFGEKRGVLRRTAAVALAHLGDAEAQAWLQESLGEGDAVLNPELARTVARGGAQDRVRTLLEPHLASDDLAVRNRAYGVLGELAEPWSTKKLLEGLEREFGEERLQPIVSLGRSGDAAVARKIEPFVATRGLVFASLEALGALGSSGSVRAVERMAGHEEALVRVYAGVALWRLGRAERAREVLEPLVEDDATSVRENLARQLQAVKDPAATQMLLRLATDAEDSVRMAALRSLEGRTGPEVVAALVTAAADPSYEVGTLALNVLARTGGAAEVDSLLPLLDDPNPYRVLAAAHAILAITDRTGPPLAETT